MKKATQVGKPFTELELVSNGHIYLKSNTSSNRKKLDFSLLEGNKQGNSSIGIISDNSEIDGDGIYYNTSTGGIVVVADGDIVIDGKPLLLQEQSTTSEEKSQGIANLGLVLEDVKGGEEIPVDALVINKKDNRPYIIIDGVATELSDYIGKAQVASGGGNTKEIIDTYSPNYKQQINFSINNKDVYSISETGVSWGFPLMFSDSISGDGWEIKNGDLRIKTINGKAIDDKPEIDTSLFIYSLENISQLIELLASLDEVKFPLPISIPYLDGMMYGLVALNSNKMLQEGDEDQGDTGGEEMPAIPTEEILFLPFYATNIPNMACCKVSFVNNEPVITYLKDTNGNESNFDFHNLKSDGTHWLYQGTDGSNACNSVYNMSLMVGDYAEASEFSGTDLRSPVRVVSSGPLKNCTIGVSEGELNVAGVTNSIILCNKFSVPESELGNVIDGKILLGDEITTLTEKKEEEGGGESGEQPQP